MNHHFVERPLMKTGILGLLLIPFVIVMMRLGPTTYPEGYTSAILAFEFVSDQVELSDVLTDIVADSEAHADLDQTNYIDFGFMMLYGIFLFLFMAAPKRKILSTDYCNMRCSRECPITQAIKAFWYYGY